MLIARCASLLFGGLFAGFLLTVLVIEWTLRDLDGSAYTLVRQVELVRLDDLATVTLLPALAAAVFLVIAAARGDRRARWLTGTAVVLLVVVLGTTLLVNLPINAEQVGWDVLAPPADWADVRDRWQVAHTVRTIAGMIAFACLSAAAISTSADRGSRRAWQAARDRRGAQPA